MEDIKMALFDVDNTLVYGKKAKIFYENYSRLLEKSFAETLGVALIEGIKIVNEHRAKYHGMGEKAFETYELGMETWYDALLKLNPSEYLEHLPVTDKVIQSLRANNIVVGAITDGPRALVDKIFAATNIDASLFDFIIGWERGYPMPKSGSSMIYEKICIKSKLPFGQVVMTGDSLYDDVLPAISAGLKGIHISSDTKSDADRYLVFKDIKPLIDLKALY